MYISMTERGVNYERYPLIPAHEHEKDGDEDEHEVRTTKLFDPQGSSTLYGSEQLEMGNMGPERGAM